MALETPTHLGRYEILDEIGRGAMGVVYLAKDPLIGRLVALKTFKATNALTGRDLEMFRARFIREAQSAGILSHPNIVTIHDVVEESEEGVTFIAMEYVRGTNLKEVLRGEGRLGLEEAAHVVAEVSEGLEYAHSRGVVHRDVKPANILLTEDRRVKLTDFGIARLGTSNLTHDGQLLGTPNYMAPEQIRGEAADHRADVFSLGVVLYEMLTGEKPFQGDNVTVVTHRIAYEEFIPPEHHGGPSLPEPVERVLDRALAKDPDLRYPSVADMAKALGEAVRQARTQEQLNETQEIPELPLPPPEEGSVGASPAPASAPGPAPAEKPARRNGVAALRGAVGGAGRRLAAAGGGVFGAIGSLGGRLKRGLGGLGGVRKGAVVKLLAAAAVVVVVAGLAVWLAVSLGSRSEGAPTPTVDPQAVQLAAAQPLLQQAQAALDAGDPAQAAQLYRAAQQVAPDVAEIADSRQRAEGQAEEARREAQRTQQVTAALADGRTALDEERWDDARAAAERVRTLDPGNTEAVDLLAQVDKTQKREIDEATTAAGADEAAAEPAATGDATLALDFFSAYPEGVLTVYFNDEQLLLEPYRFYKRGKFLRLEGTAGTIKNSYTVPAGAADVRIIVALPDRPAISRLLQGNFPSGSTRRLEVRLEEGRELVTRLE